MSRRFNLRLSSGQIESLIAARVIPVAPPGGDYSSAYRYARFLNPQLGGLSGMSLAAPRRYNALGVDIGSLLDTYNPLTGRQDGRVFPISHAVATRDEGGVIGEAGTSEAIIDANATALTNALIAAANNVNGGRVRINPAAIFGAVRIPPGVGTRVSNRAWVVLETAGIDSVRPVSQRHQLADDASMAQIITRQKDNVGAGWLYPAISIEGGASFVRINGIRTRLAEQGSRVSNLGLIGTVDSQASGTNSDNGQWIVIDRCHMDGRDTANGLKRGAVPFGRFVASIGNRYTEIGDPVTVTDAQALRFLSYGPYLSDNDWFSSEQASQNILLGGAPFAAGGLPQDIQIIDGYHESSTQRAGVSVPAKTYIEIKYGRRIWIENNTLSGNRPLEGTFTAAITVKMAANGATESELATEDVVVRLNRGIDIPVVSVTGRDSDAQGAPNNTRRVIIEQNISPPAANPEALLTATGEAQPTGLRIAPDAQVVAHHNTIVAPHSTRLNSSRRVILTGGGVQARTDWLAEANILLWPDVSIFNTQDVAAGYAGFDAGGAGILSSRPAWDAITKTRAAWRRNGIAWRTPGSAAQSTWVIGHSTADADLVAADYAAAGVGADGALSLASPFRGVDADGGDLGADPILHAAARTRADTGL